MRAKNAPFVRSFLALSAVLATASIALGQTNPQSLSGLVMDDTQAVLTGEWTSSTSVKPYLGKSYIHDGAKGKGEKSARFTFRVPVEGDYQLLIAYTAGGNRAVKVPVVVHSADGKARVELNQSQKPLLATGFQPIGKFTFSDTADGIVVIETAGTRQHVIVDGIRLLTAAEFKAVEKEEKNATRPKVVAKNTAKKKPPKPKPVPPKFVRRAAKADFREMSPEQLGKLLSGSDSPALKPIGDIAFLRRASLDLVGRQPTLDEYRAFVTDKSPDRRQKSVERLLASDAFGQNWGNYWNDVIAARQPEPQLTYLNYKPFRAWLAAELNAGTGWDEIVFRTLSAIGTVGDRPEGTFIGFHQGERNRLAGESARVFLGLKIGCAQCHDHPFVDMPQETFHGMAAFFARTKVKLPWNDSNGIEISSTDKGEHKMPGGKTEMIPTVYRGEKFDLGLSDLDRRERLAYWMVSGDNPFFARAFVNHIQARLMGRGFFHPVDDLGEGAEPLNEKAHRALADHLVASNFDVKSLFRLIVSTKAYQSERTSEVGFSGGTPKKLRGDEVFDSLKAAIELPNVETKVAAATDKTRFPPPPKSTRDLVNEAFGFDPSTKDELITRTMKQAIFMMNNDQIHRQIDASPGSGTMLARLLESEQNNGVVIDVLYARVLARQPTKREREILLKHVQKAGARGPAFEDVLWSLLNSAEFTTRH